ncbi:MAG: homocysteine S-methyltransferase family protein [Pseudomonadota bacterium]
MTDIVLLDGGMGQELVRRSKDPAHPQWGAWVMMNEPEVVQGLHEDYIRAGAKAITINAYSINRSRLTAFNMAERLGELQGIALDIASRARDAFDSETTILGCLPPLIGSYHPELMPPEADTFEEYREVVSLQANRVDAFICETMGSATEGRLAATAACESGKPVWVAWTLDEAVAEDGQPRLRSSETVAEAVAALGDLPVEAIMFNCTAPEAMTAGMDTLIATGKPTGGYANGFTPIPKEFTLGQTVDMIGKRRDLDPAGYAKHAMGWVARGARIIGGCCETSPDHIAELKTQLEAKGHRAVGRLMSETV